MASANHATSGAYVQSHSDVGKGSATPILIFWVRSHYGFLVCMSVPPLCYDA